MAKGHGGQGGGRNNKKKDARREKAARRGAAGAGAGTTPTGTAVITTEAPVGLAATRGAVSPAYRAWAVDYGRRQAQGVAAEHQSGAGELTPDLFVLAPLTSRTVSTPSGLVMLVQMGLPIGATRAGSVALLNDRLALTVLHLLEPDSGGALAMLGLGRAPEMPEPEAVFALQLGAEGLRGVRAADAVAWRLARVLEAGDVDATPDALLDEAGRVLALVRPAVAPRGASPLPAADLDEYVYGAETDEEAVPTDITAAPARGGVSALPNGAFLTDDGIALSALLADLGDYVIGLWPYEYFGLEALIARQGVDAPGGARTAMLADLAALVRRVDGVLAEILEHEEAALASEGRPPAWIAEETAPLRQARQSLRASRAVGALIPPIGPILFDLEVAPADYTPPTPPVQGDDDL